MVEGNQRRKNSIFLSYKLRQLCSVACIDDDKFFYDMNRLYKIDYRTSQSWFKSEDDDVKLNETNRDNIIHYFTTVHSMPIAITCFKSEKHDFDKNIPNIAVKREEYILRRAAQSKNIFGAYFGEPDSFEDIEAKYICGIYQAYRFSFVGDNKKELISEIYEIFPMEAHKNICSVKMYCYPIDADEQTQGRQKGLTPLVPDMFSGVIFRFGMTYNIITAHDDKMRDKRIRFVQFPFLEKMRRTRHFGIIAGYSTNVNEPVASRIIAKKLPFLNVDDNVLRKIRRHKYDDSTVAEYTSRLEVDPHIKGQWLMTVAKREVSGIGQ